MLALGHRSRLATVLGLLSTQIESNVGQRLGDKKIRKDDSDGGCRDGRLPCARSSAGAGQGRVPWWDLQKMYTSWRRNRARRLKPAHNKIWISWWALGRSVRGSARSWVDASQKQTATRLGWPNPFECWRDASQQPKLPCKRVTAHLSKRVGLTKKDLLRRAAHGGVEVIVRRLHNTKFNQRKRDAVCSGPTARQHEFPSTMPRDRYSFS